MSNNDRDKIVDVAKVKTSIMAKGFSDKKIEEVEEGPTKDDATLINEQLDRVI